MTYTVAKYLKARLEALNLKQLFGVAGNYTAPFLDTILEDPHSPIAISGNANEICAGFAADAYARTQGIGAVYVTYSVGAFSLINTIAGSFVEKVPVVLINGAPTNKEQSIEANAGLLYSHTTGNATIDMELFRPVTAAAERIVDARLAPFQIDAALTALVTQKQPVYLEVAEDVWRAACQAPTGTISASGPVSISVSEAKAAALATVELLKARPKSIFWAGVELQRLGLQDAFVNLLSNWNQHRQEATGFVTSALSKSVISENHPAFKGCVTLNEKEIQQLIGDDGLIIGVGAWTIGKDTGNQNIRSEGTVLAFDGGVLVGAKYFPAVALADYIAELTTAIADIKDHACMQCAPLQLPVSRLQAATGQVPLGYDSFFHCLNGWLKKDDVLVVDAGFPLIGAQAVKITEQDGFLAQAAWLSIGYSVPAATGVKCARPDKRAMVVVGDGSFHETCQAFSDQSAYGHNTVVFVISNGIYGIEQYLVNPNPFREPPKDYDTPLQNKVYTYNELPRWDFVKFAEAMGGEGRKVTSVTALLDVLEEIRATPDGHFLVELVVDKTNVPKTIADEATAAVGEDETANPHWPPAAKF